ncbi:phosphatidylinositol-4-kinase [Polychaeton citri CBS 116435]|uniref:1-phosphatidylinositol 4-kinase n=1 Tax=Polychaeton citri CBS 116435 TaxID=1314669 RepID=A0A9P4Q480_9PEZI|nr:phosphatidylinositol-4-kinase [Polychaeton citri CBS 116435]
MDIRELEVLLALCQSAEYIANVKDAETLLAQLEPYLPEAHLQAFGHVSLLSREAPWHVLSQSLTAALLSIAINHSGLENRVYAGIDRTLQAMSHTASALSRTNFRADPYQAIKALELAASIAGFMAAIAQHSKAWQFEQRLDLIEDLRRLVSEDTMVAIEGALSAVRNAHHHNKTPKAWLRWLRQYATNGQPLGAMLLERELMAIVEASLEQLVPVRDQSMGILERFDQQPSLPLPYKSVDPAGINKLAEMARRELERIDNEDDYLQVSSPRQQQLTMDAKASSLRSYVACLLIHRPSADTSVITAAIDASMIDPIEMSSEVLCKTVLKALTLVAKCSPPIATQYSRTLPRLLVQGKLTPSTAALTGVCLAQILASLSQDVMISTIYSLGNTLSGSSGDEKPASATPFLDTSTNSTQNGIFSSHQGSVISLATNDEIETAVVHSTIVRTIVAITVASNDDGMAKLVSQLLAQKMGRISPALDARIISETAALGLCGDGKQLTGLLAFYTRMMGQASARGDTGMQDAVNTARIKLASSIKPDSPLYESYLKHLLGLIVSSGDVAGDGKAVDVAAGTRMITQVLRPLATLLSNSSDESPYYTDEDAVQILNRDAWFNIAVHGFHLNSRLYLEHLNEFQIIAQQSLPFVDEERIDAPESGIDLNTVLRRGAGPQQSLEQKNALIKVIPSCESDVRGLSHAECVYLNAALLVCMLRARSGDCTFALPFFLEGKTKITSMGRSMQAIAVRAVDTYVQRALAGKQQAFAAPQIALQLKTFFEGCCHRVSRVQHAATMCADRIINAIPSSLCQKASIFALLELLTLLWRGCLDSETDEYTPTASYRSERAQVHILLSDDMALRQTILRNLHQRSKMWIAKVTDWAPLDVKGLLQAYLEDFDDDGAYGHISLGRSFAVELGSMIPSSDQRLASIDRSNSIGISTASDFVAQYTTRQEYRALESFRVKSDEADSIRPLAEADDEVAHLRSLSVRLQRNESVLFSEVRESLQSAAAFLSRTRSASIALIQDLVGVPFKIFTKQSIKFGISLWMGIIKENPGLQNRVLVEVAMGWESSVRLKRGFFNTSISHLNPFFVKEEFAPSSHEALARRQQLIHDLLAPHLRLVHCLTSSFSASRLTAPSVERIFARMIRTTLLAMRRAINQPLARELHFHIVLLGLKVLRHGTNLNQPYQWRLKDAILSAGLNWFTSAPKWSFGSNRLQAKAEIRLLGDVLDILQSVGAIGVKGTKALPPLQSKQELLRLLVSHEIERLGVWINPLTPEPRGSRAGAALETAAHSLLSTAWAEDPRLAIQITTRLHSPRLTAEVRRFVLAEAHKVANEADALDVLLGTALPSDCSAQLRYLLYWTPVNPMAAVTYFLPAYGNHPLIIQYAVRALESHSVDVTFFYVPQIVQTLRYDALGYVERYIIEAAKFSQLFAHQIIWNMKANAFKDEESQIPDPVKPVLDRVMDSLISSFSAEDKDFFEREFDFFGKVTGISGTLKPFIKEPKPVKKAKIEEELRKIQVDVGVYLPSNPDGVIVGIDRKSGKPLQSHAKAPYMATFRIRKELGGDSEEQIIQGDEMAKHNTYDVWQSAIFKVGDDCRQDVLALQMIAAFRGIFNNVGLDVYVFPYRVTATAPGCGVIDVLPNSTSRDMLGREAVNDLYQYFVSKYGGEDSVRFQQARSNFIKSMAAYSIISYLLQFKDRHNGNIMVDDAGHILHIDFGFCFDIAPGGIKFERAPFKLTPEMVAVMGGSAQSQPFKQFEELIVKAFLASRQYVEQLSHIVLTMLDSGLPCFKPQTIQHFKERFVLEKSDREAAEFVRKLVHWSERSYSTGVYDYFQLLTNGIPY